MSKLAAILTVVLSVVTTAVSENNSSLSCYEELENSIVKHRALILKLVNSNARKFDDAFTGIRPNESVFWKSVQIKKSVMPKLTFLEMGVEVTGTNLSDDGSCRDFVKKFGKSEIAACSGFLRYAIISDKHEMSRTIFELVENLGKYRMTPPDDTNLIAAGFYESVCRNKIESVHRVTEHAVVWINKMMQRSMQKMSDFVGNLSFCLMFQRPDVALFSAWREACWFYDIV